MTEKHLNEIVRVKLTDYGLHILNTTYDYLYEPDEQGYHKFPLWRLMLVFGQYMYPGNRQMPFEKGAIYFEEKGRVRFSREYEDEWVGEDFRKSQ